MVFIISQCFQQNKCSILTLKSANSNYLLGFIIITWVILLSCWADVSPNLSISVNVLMARVLFWCSFQYNHLKVWFSTLWLAAFTETVTNKEWSWSFSVNIPIFIRLSYLFSCLYDFCSWIFVSILYSIFSLQLNESHNTRIQFSPSNQICFSHSRHLWKLVSMTDKKQNKNKKWKWKFFPFILQIFRLSQNFDLIPSLFSQKFELVSQTFNIEMITLNFDLWIEKIRRVFFSDGCKLPWAAANTTTNYQNEDVTF